ncbi:MAG TPA: entericidin A/B family lipoprotein [Azospirillaceae bacterium]|nr:entericidin A/B family lipoprotein [Azospirillaceae bacterium]
MTTKTVEHPLRHFLLATSVLLLAGLLVGCNTLEGFGEDTQAAGEAIEGQAKSGSQ